MTMDERMGAVALVSGGLDSCVAATWAARRYDLRLLHASYGQRTAARERRAFDAIADALSITADRRMQVTVEVLDRVGGSSLTDMALPVEQADPDPARIPGTYVPFRNTHLLAAAVTWAEVVGARRVVIGCVEQDSSGYPDCRRDYVEAFNRLVERGTRPGAGIQVEAPLVELGKAEVVRMGLKLGAPLEHTWSCYTGTRLACGTCESCRLRLKGFREAGATDPIPYA
jgi:7-cyano-7-deazaguanine synthase